MEIVSRELTVNAYEYNGLVPPETPQMTMKAKLRWDEDIPNQFFYSVYGSHPFYDWETHIDIHLENWETADASEQINGEVGVMMKRKYPGTETQVAVKSWGVVPLNKQEVIPRNVPFWKSILNVTAGDLQPHWRIREADAYGWKMTENMIFAITNLLFNVQNNDVPTKMVNYLSCRTGGRRGLHLLAASTLKYCEMCFTGEDHTTCPECYDAIDPEDIYKIEMFDSVYHEECFYDNFFECAHCNEWESDEYAHIVVAANGETRYCENCASIEAMTCDGCAMRFTENSGIWYHVTDFGDTFCEECYEEETCDCEACLENQGRNSLIEDWDYQPRWVMHGRKHTMDVGPFFGLEIETSWAQRIQPLPEITRWANDTGVLEGDLIYIKTDSSVHNGYEIVTHPMTFEWAMENFPFKAFDKLVTKYNALESEDSCGGHVHINKDSFTNAHLYKFIQFHHRLGDFCELMGGRDGGQWGTLKSNSWKAERKHAKSTAMMKFSNTQQRYMGLNFMPEYTVELRYPAGGSSSYLIKKNLQLAHAVWSFTKEVDVALFKEGILDDPGYFLWWLRENTDTYPELNTWVDKHMPQPKSFKKETV